MEAGGQIVKLWVNHFLRDDSDIRKSSGIEPEEAYSLFRKSPYGRLHVFAGPRDWAIEQAEMEIENEK